MNTRTIACTLMLMAVTLLAQDKAPPVNLLKNPGFENPDAKNVNLPADWGVFAEKGEPSAFMLVTEAKEGGRALKLAFEGKTARFYGIGQRIPVKAGQPITFSANVRNVSIREESYVQLSIEWVGGTEQEKKEISRSWGPLSKATDMTTDSWKKFEVTAIAPAGAIEMNIVVTLFPMGGTDGAVLIDDLNVGEPKPAIPPKA
jgi:hypothetical protein